MREDASERSNRYIEVTSHSLKRLKLKRRLPVGENLVRQVIDLADGYVKDARHYASTCKPVSSLACVAYAEGLLDALKFLELVEF